MQQQFFVGDVVKLNQLGVEIGKLRTANTSCTDHDLWNIKYLLMVNQQTKAVVSETSVRDVWLEDNAFFVSSEHLEVVERQWQKNTGMQPVDDDVFVEYKQCYMVWQAERAGDLIWTNSNILPITEWRIVDSIPSDEGQPEGVPPSHVALGDELVSIDVAAQQEWTDKHYDNNYALTQKDIERGFVKIDPYRVSKQWRLGSKDESGVLFHILKTAARFGEKNSRQREIKALYAQIKCLAEIEGVDLNG